VHALDELVEHVRGILDDRGVVQLVAVQQPAREIELGVQQRAVLQAGVVRRLAPGAVRVEDLVADIRHRSHHPCEVARRVADRQRRPADHGAHRAVLDEQRVVRERPVDHGRQEAPQRLVGRRGVPAAAQCGWQRARGLGAVDDRHDGALGVLGGLPRQAGIEHEADRQRMDRRDGLPRRRGDPAVHRLESEGRTGEEVVDHGPRAVVGRLALHRRHLEGQP